MYKAHATSDTDSSFKTPFSLNGGMQQNPKLLHTV